MRTLPRPPAWVLVTLGGLAVLLWGGWLYVNSPARSDSSRGRDRGAGQPSVGPAVQQEAQKRARLLDRVQRSVEEDVADLLHDPDTIDQDALAHLRELARRRSGYEAERRQIARELSDGSARSLLSAGPESGPVPAPGEWLLLRAVEAGRPEVVRALLEVESPADLEAHGRLSLLRAAVASGNVETVGILLDAGFGPGPSGLAALLRTAAGQGGLPMVSKLLGAGADPNAPDDHGMTAVHLAAGRSEPADDAEGAAAPALALLRRDLLGLLADAGGDVTARDDSGRSPLHLAVEGRPRLSRVVQPAPDTLRRAPVERPRDAARFAGLESLLGAGADINARDAVGRTPLHYAARRLRPALFGFLLDRGADPAAVAADGRSVLHEAAEWRNVAAVRELVGLGADVDARMEQGLTPLGAAVRAASYGCQWEIMDADRLPMQFPNDADRREVIERAVLDRTGQVARALLEAGADPNGTVRGERTALVEALDNGFWPVAETLLAAGADPNRGDRLVPIHEAVLQQRPDIVKSLIEAGAYVDAVTPDGWAPLHEAARRGDVESVEALLEAGADPSLKDARGNTPADLAERFNEAETVELLANY